MRKQERLNYQAIVMLLIVLTQLTTACANQPEIQIRDNYIYIHDVPDAVFPIFPPPDSVTLRAYA